MTCFYMRYAHLLLPTLTALLPSPCGPQEDARRGEQLWRNICDISQKPVLTALTSFPKRLIALHRMDLAVSSPDMAMTRTGTSASSAATLIAEGVVGSLSRATAAPAKRHATLSQAAMAFRLQSQDSAAASLPTASSMSTASLALGVERAEETEKDTDMEQASSDGK